MIHRSRTELIGSTALNHTVSVTFTLIHGYCMELIGASECLRTYSKRKGKEQGKIKCSFLHSLLDSRDKFEPKVVGSIAEILINRMIHIFFVQSESQAD